MFKKKNYLKFTCLVLLFTLCFTLMGCKNNKPVETNFPEIVNGLKSYKLEATLNTIFQNGNKECNVIVYFEHPNNYRVELSNTLVNEKQIMIRNDKGVFVILPSINKTFKINSEWPNTSNQPFLLHSLSKDILNNENLTKKSENGKTTLELSTKIFDNVEPIKEKIVFDDKTKLPTEVYIYRSNGELFNHLVVKSIEKNPTLNKELFIVDNTITSSRLDYIESPIEFDRSITYPAYCPYNTKLNTESITGNANNKTAVMKFSGDYSFTLLECYVDSTENLKTEYFSGDIYIMAGSFALIANNTMKFYTNGIEYTLASSTTNYEELVMIAESLGNYDIK